ncbi:MAG: NCS2 family permease [Phycisphaerales bacterium]|nr:NCS2 family permease [Phycisphaerales bacterium]
MRAFVKHDLDGFFGLFIDNLVQLLLIVALCGGMCGMTGEHARLIHERILPGAAVSILLGNLFYAWQAHRVAARERRDDVTALPFGINTPSLLVYVFFVMAPVYRSTGSPEAAWRMGLLACIGSGLIEFFGSFVAERIRRNTPRAALLSTLAGIAIGFIAMKFALEIFVSPVVGMLPMAIILVTYFANRRMPLGLPGGLMAVACGTLIAWCLPGDWLIHPMSAAAVGEAWMSKGWHPPQWAGDAIRSLAELSPADWLGFVSVIVPMGLINVVASLQNIESAEAGGDRFNTTSSLAVNGIGTLAAAAFGSCFPTTIYIGHPGWKKLGARAGYSTLNGLVITALCFTGTVSLVNSLVPLEAGIAIVLWIGLVMTAQAFQATPREHAPAVALGLFPAIAAWGATVMWGAFFAAQLTVTDVASVSDGVIETRVLSPVGSATTMQTLLEMDHSGAGRSSMVNGFLIHGLNLMERGYIFTCMVLSALAASLIDGRFRAAAVWAIVGSVFAAVGLSHSYTLVGNTVDYHLLFGDAPDGAYAYSAWPIAIGYLMVAGVCLAFARQRETTAGS